MNLNELREEIDKIDDEVLRLFLKRLGLCREIGRIKMENDLAIENLKREEEILKKVKEAAGENSPAAESLFKNIIYLCKKVQYKI